MSIRYLIPDERYIYELHEDNEGFAGHPAIEVSEEFEERYIEVMQEFFHMQRQLQMKLRDKMIEERDNK